MEDTKNGNCSDCRKPKDAITINMGGVKFETTRTTLTAAPYFSMMFDGYFREAEEEMTEMFIDRDPKLFEEVLAYLRNPEIYVSDNAILEGKFYGLDIPPSIDPYTHRLKACVADFPDEPPPPQKELERELKKLAEEAKENPPQVTDAILHGGGSTGGLICLAAKGPQDMYEKDDWSLHMAALKRFVPIPKTGGRSVVLSDVSSHDPGRHVYTWRIGRNGDLVTNLWLIFAVSPSVWKLIASPRYDGIREIRLEIGGHENTAFSGEFLRVRELCHTDPRALKHLVALDRSNHTVCIRLPFHFCGDFSKLPVFGKHEHTMPLPLVALQFHDVQIRLHLNDELLIVHDPKLRVEYQLLDTKFRREVAQGAWENINYQIQEDCLELNPGETACRIRLNWNHPAVRIYMGARCVETGEYWPVSEFTLRLNNHVVMNESHRTLKQDMLENQKMYTKKNVYCIEMWRRQEGINFSRIDNATVSLRLKCNPNGVRLMLAVQNYNVTKVASGMSGVMYCN